MIEELLTTLTENGSEVSLGFMVLFSLYQMYSPTKLPETKGQKFIRNLLELLEKINAQGSDKGAPQTDDGEIDDKSTDTRSPKTQ